MLRTSTMMTVVLIVAYSSMLTLAQGPFTQQPEVIKSIPAVEPGKTASQSDSSDSPQADDSILARGPQPTWIWGADANAGYTLRKTFSVKAGIKNAWIQATCDNQMVLRLNGRQIASSNTWETPIKRKITSELKVGQNELVAEVANAGGPSGFVAKLAIQGPRGRVQSLVSDQSWKCFPSGTQNPTAIKTHGKLGAQPWGDVFAQVTLASGPRGVFKTLPGFQVEKLFTVPKGELGSWVCITFDDQGRLLASDQGRKGICRITPPPIGSDQPTKVEKLGVNISAAQGMLHAFGSLYFSVNGGPGSGFYRARDTNNDDQYDEVVKLKALAGGGEHGPHTLRLSPDGKSIYLIAGNHTNPPSQFDASRIPSNWGEDLLLPRQWDARGHARGKLAPGGWIAKTDPDGITWEIFSIGYRNPYSMDFNADGELFAYDADMEWDMGMPWYRPTRVVHATSGSEFGWRSGTGKWPTYFPDSLPPVVNIGPGSPVGARFGYGSKFPARYQRALYILDWTFGTMYAVHLKPEGASYRATKEEFLSRTPLPLTDLAIGPDGALYFTIGGRGTQSELFRVTYVGDEPTGPVDARDTNSSTIALRELRNRLESLHGTGPSEAKILDFIFQNLGHPDRHIRYAARVALEHRETSAWQKRALGLEDASALITAVVALARQGEKQLQPELLQALDGLWLKQLSKTQQLELLRAYALTFIRMGEPNKETAAKLAKRLESVYPAADDQLNAELARLLVYLQSDQVVRKSVALMKQERDFSQKDMAELLARNQGYGGKIAQMLANMPDLRKLHYAFVLRNAKKGWTVPLSTFYFRYLQQARGKKGGASYQGFITNMENEAFANASDIQRLAVEAAGLRKPAPIQDLPMPKGPGHDWTVEEILGLTSNGLSGRNFENGQRTYAAARCVICHRFGGEGGATGPDLTQAAGRFGIKDMTEALIHPSRVVSDQYRMSIVLTAGGKVITGRLASEDADSITILTDPEDSTKVTTIARQEVEELSPSKTSAMPTGLLKPLNKAEVLDLLAYLLSRGDPKDPMFKKPASRASGVSSAASQKRQATR